MEPFLPYIICACVAIAVWACLEMATQRKKRIDNRLDELRTVDRAAYDGRIKHMPEFAEKAAPALADIVRPRDQMTEKRLRAKLAHAGFSGPSAITMFLAMKAASLGVGFLAGSSISAAIWGVSTDSLLGAFVGAALGLFLPDVIVMLMGKNRQQQIFLSLPSVLDLLVVCVEVGKGIDAAFQEVCGEMQSSAPKVCEELGMYNSQIQLGMPRRDALHQLGIRAGVDDMNSLAAVLIQADRFGSSIASTLRDLSDSMRIKRRQMAEEQAQKTAVKLLFPLVLFIFPGIFVVLVGPAAISLMTDFMSL